MYIYRWAFFKSIIKAICSFTISVKREKGKKKKRLGTVREMFIFSFIMSSTPSPTHRLARQKLMSPCPAAIYICAFI